MLYALMALNVLVYVAWQVAYNDVAMARFMGDNFLVSVRSMSELRVWTLLTSCFSHIDPTHLLVNMLALWVFGGAVYAITGPMGFLQLYIVGGLLASAGHVLWGLASGDINPALGASGSVMAIAVVYGAAFPRRTLLINFLLPVPAALAVAGYILYDIWGAFSGGDGIAHAAHLGGAAYGLVYWLAIGRARFIAMTQPR